MRKIFKLSTAFLGFALLFGTSCKKYEEGPGISLASKKARVANTWAIDKYLVDDVEQDLTFFAEFSIEITKDGKYTTKWGGLEETGTWEFGDKKETIKMTEDGETDVEESTILKLKSKELWLKNVENGITYIQQLKEK